MRSMYAMDVGRGMGVCGRVVEEIRFDEGGPTVTFEYSDGTAQTIHAHDRIDVDDDTPQRRARVDRARGILDPDPIDTQFGRLYPLG